jgi:DNA gyrase/topoisomerase IV subunit A
MPETKKEGALFGHLLQTIDQTLARSRKSFSTEDAIRDCYGDDASMFDEGASDSNNFLASAIDAMVDQVNTKVKSEMLEFLGEEKIEERLNEIEGIIHELNNHDRIQKEADEEDRNSARAALEGTKLPKDVQPEDILRYQNHRLLLAEREKLLAAISKIEEDVEALDKRIEESGGQVDEGLKSLQVVKEDLQNSVLVLEKSKNED